MIDIIVLIVVLCCFEYVYIVEYKTYKNHVSLHCHTCVFLSAENNYLLPISKKHSTFSKYGYFAVSLIFHLILLSFILNMD